MHGFGSLQSFAAREDITPHCNDKHASGKLPWGPTPTEWSWGIVDLIDSCCCHPL
jgi:hypothetical protein